MGVQFELAGQVALVTGASRNLGAAFAKELARAGADVALIARDEQGLAETAAEVRSLGRKAATFTADILDTSLLPDLVTQVEAALGPVDILINNAGGNIPAPFMEVTEETYDRIMDLNLKSLFFLSQVVARGMAERRQGRIINISSQLGVVGMAGRSAYSAAKGGVNALTRTMAIELAPHGITVNAVAPTYIETSPVKKLLENPEFRADVLRRLPIGRVGQPHEVTGAVLFLCTREAGLITGHTLLVDGGYTAW